MYSEVESRMFYIWKTVRRPRRLEKEWFELIHGSEKWQDIEISHFQNRTYINEIEKELKKRKIDPKKTDPKTIDILKRPIVKNGVYVSYIDKKMAQERINEWDRVIISNYTDLKSDIEKMLKNDKYGYYMNRLLKICLPTFILDEFKEKKLDIE